MAIPAKSPVHVKAALMGKPGDNVLDGTSQDVAIMRQTSGKWRAIIESVPRCEIKLALSECCITDHRQTIQISMLENIFNQ